MTSKVLGKKPLPACMRTVFIALALLLAGCATPSPTLEDDDPALEATETTGCIRGLVVDETVTPIDSASVQVIDGPATETDANGEFSLCDLAPGVLFLSVTHPFYDEVQGTATVEAGEARPPALKFQLTRQVFAEPYTQQHHIYGYLTCSSNVGGVIAEECGEGAGVPCSVLGQPVPVLGCQRVGGFPDNEPEARFYTDGGPIKTIQAEVVWEPSFTLTEDVQSGGFTVIMATNHICDPVCRYDDSLDDKVGESPLIMRTEDGDQGSPRYFTAPDKTLEEANITADDWVSVFIWQTDQDMAGVTFDQEFEVLVTVAYVLPLPEDFTVVDGDLPPF